MEALYFDARFIRLDHHDGISRFSTELIAAVSKTEKVIAIICDLKQLEFLPKGIEHVQLNKPEALSEFFIARKLNKLGAKYVYSPMQIMGSWGRKYKLVLTLHDLIYYRHRKPPTDLSWLIRVIWRLYHLSYFPQRLLLNRADAIVTVSETTKALMLKHHLTKRPIQVVYNSAGKAIKQARTFNNSKDLLYIGSFMPYKNVENLIIGTAQTKGFTLHLLSKITEQRKAELVELAQVYETKVVFHQGVSDEEYEKLLSECFALVTASKDEGFGIPLVEAMSHGTPVVVSDLDIFMEVAGKAGHYFNPNSPASFAKQIDFLSNKSKWESCSKQSLAQAKMFDWDKSATALIETFNSLKN
ncbi:MAG: hypothetical protein RIQ88_523 [Actinomycetota bacterium]